MKTPSFEVADFGTTKYGEKARVFTLRGAGAMTLVVSDYGCKAVKLFVPDREGRETDVIIGFDDPSGWERYDPFWGSVIGRYANRIAAGRFTLNGVTHEVPLNNVSNGMPCALHGGTRGWDAYVWGAEPFVRGDEVGVVFTRVSPDGENGFPGNVKAKVTYVVTPDDTWRCEFEAVPDRDTPICMLQHVCFNLRGEGSGSVDDHVLTLACSKTTPTNVGKIPTGEIRDVAGTPFDFRAGMRLGDRINEPDEQLEIGEGYDHNFILDEGEMSKGPSAAGRLNRAGSLHCPLNGRFLEVFTTEPCVHLCTTNWAHYGEKAKGGEHLSFRCAVALETQHAPDSPNRPEWPTTVVKTGARYATTTEFRFGVK